MYRNSLREVTVDNLQKLCSGYGQYYSENHKTNPRKYFGITLNEILEMLEDPPSVAKQDAQFGVGSGLNGHPLPSERLVPAR
jgi:hypothetical protein